MDWFRRQNKVLPVFTEAQETELQSIDDESALTEEQRLLYQHFSSLSESCQNLLRLFYYGLWEPIIS